MPNRFIRESCRTSPNLALLSHGAERFFWRLITVADDFGRFEAAPDVLLCACFPKLLDRVKITHIKDWLTEVVTCQLVTTYVRESRTYAFFNTWDKHQRTRAKHSKYPAPTSADIGGHVTPNVADLRPTTYDLRPTNIHPPTSADTPTPKRSTKTPRLPIADDFAPSDAIKGWAAAQSISESTLLKHCDNFKDTCQANDYKYINWDAAFRRAIRDNWAKIVPEPPGEFDHLPRINSDDYWYCGCRRDTEDRCKKAYHGMTLQEYYAWDDAQIAAQRAQAQP